METKRFKLIALFAAIIGMGIFSLPTFAAEAIKIGASLPLTGGFAIAGQKHKAGYDLCVEIVNKNGGLLGRQVELIVSDNRSDTETSIAQLERFISVDKVDLLFGTFSSKLTFPTSSITEKAGMVYPIPSGGALRIWERGYKNIFYFQVNAAEYIGNSPMDMLNDLVKKADHPKTAAVVHADDFFSNAIAAGLIGRDVKIPGSDKVVTLAPGSLKKVGIELKFTQQWPEEGFSDWVNLANSIKASGAELVIGLTASPDETIQLVRAMQTVNYQPKMVYLSQGTQDEFKQAVGTAANGILMHSAWHPKADWSGVLAGKKFSNKDFQAAFKAKYNRDADEDEAIPFAVCQGMEQAVRATKSTDNGKLREWLSSRTKSDPVKTILGNFNWDKRGLPVDRPFLLLQWQDGNLNFVYPTDEFPGTSKLIWPKPKW